MTSAELDPSNPDILYAAAYQRRRSVAAFMGGGPESGIHKSTDAGKTWRKLTVGLPEGDMGKIGLAVSPIDPRVVYATVEASPEERGFYRSTQQGRELGEAQLVHQRRHRPALLPGDLRRPEPLRPGLPDGPGPARDRRWRDDVAAGEREEQARRQPRDGVRQGRARLPPQRQRRRRLREPRRREDLALLREPAGHAVLQDRARQRRAVLQRARRDAGQRQPVGPVADAERARDRQRRLGDHLRRRRLQHRHRPDRPEHDLRRVAGRQPAALRPEEPRDGLHQPEAGTVRAAAPLQLGLAGHRQPALAHADLLRRPVPLAQRQPRRLVDEGEPGPHAEHLPAGAANHGSDVERRRAVAPRRHVDVLHHHDGERIAAGRRPDLRRAPTTA